MLKIKAAEVNVSWILVPRMYQAPKTQQHFSLDLPCHLKDHLFWTTHPELVRRDKDRWILFYFFWLMKKKTFQ